MALYVEFAYAEPEQRDSITRVVDALREAKRSGEFRDDSHWLAFFDDEARSTFWWPTPEELDSWQKRWFSTPPDQRLSDPALETPWDFGSMIEAFQNGDYDLLGCREVGDGLARIEFDAHAYPYGGTGCMHALIEAFGGEVRGECAA